MQSTGALFGLSPQTFSLKIITLFLKKTCSKKVSYIFSKKTFLIFRKRNFLICSHKKFFFYFGKGIFRTLACLELEAYSEPYYIQNPRHIQHTVKHLRWNVLQKSYVAHFSSPSSKNEKSSSILLYFGKWNFLALVLDVEVIRRVFSFEYC